MSAPSRRPIRRPGSPWRLLVHEYAGRRSGGTLYSTAHDVSNDPKHTRDGRHSKGHLLPANTEFDELVVGKWLHIEQMDTGSWWADIGGLIVRIAIDRDGQPTAVTYGVEDPREGVVYEQDGAT